GEIIVDRTHKSRKTILLLTPAFVKSNWCEFQFSMAHSHSISERALSWVSVNAKSDQVKKKNLS
ncbi:hypothetical protein CAPTEDRAFT_106792, partial [Capitella teleta]